MREEWFQFAHEKAWLEAIHSQWLPLTLAKLPQQNLFEIIKWLIGDTTSNYSVQNVLKDLLGQDSQSAGVPKFFIDSHLSELGLDEAEPDLGSFSF